LRTERSVEASLMEQKVDMSFVASTIDSHSPGMPGLHILCSLPHQDTSTGDAIRAYLKLAPEAANEQDSDGLTPFQHLCKSEMTFLDD